MKQKNEEKYVNDTNVLRNILFVQHPNQRITEESEPWKPPNAAAFKPPGPISEGTEHSTCESEAAG